MRLFLFGAGYSARAIARELAGQAQWIGGTTRSEDGFGDLRASGIAPFLFEGRKAGTGPLPLAEITHLVVSISPDEAGDPVLDALGEAAATSMPALRWIGYLSTIGVYGDRGGDWVDEDGDRDATSRRGQERVQAEDAWTRLGDEIDVPTAILRLGGIYGPGRNQLVKLADGTARRIIKPGQYFNRIHVDDIAGAVRHLMDGAHGGAFNIVDDEPVAPEEPIEYAAELMGTTPPPATAFEAAEMSDMARSFYSDVKRVRNDRLKATGYVLRYPSYRAGLHDLWTGGTWRGRGADDARSPIRSDRTA